MRKSHRFVSIALFFLITGCGNDDLGMPPSETDLPGTYSLESIGGDPLPDFLHGSEIAEGTLVIDSDGTWSMILHPTGGPDTQENGTYTYDASDGSLALESDLSGALQGTAGENAVEITVPVGPEEGTVLRYVKN
ncbi:MAG TPA: hypothetical protein VI895_02385 [Bdellovibrionota bacterium]|nr:hypothetical protein [Bdellovibrionota bacterium]